MKVVIQRVKKASVEVNGEIVGQIGQGFLLLVGLMEGDSEKDIEKAADKIAMMRLFDDENGVMNKSLLDIGGSILSISQFTLAADARKGNRPSYILAMKPEEAQKGYALFNQKLRDKGIEVAQGVFQAEMAVSLINDGPVTVVLNVEDGKVI